MTTPDEPAPASRPEHDDPARYIELAGFEGEWRELWWDQDFLRLMARRLGLGEVRRALDVGCGAGHWGRTLLPHLPGDAELVGVDRVEAFLELAAREAVARELDGRCRYQLAAAESLPFPDASFDLVTCQTVLIHVADPARALAEIHRVLRPGGRLVFIEHVAAEDRPDRLVWQRRLEPLWKRVAGNCHVTRRTEQAISAAGFDITEITRASMRKAMPIVRPTIRGYATKVG
ncbi:MAG: class I SAM-dependent methyltransferase [Myxococcales bacterium]|nr:class I SAM-dependent methyltransferase [Myxococcales bacterium]